LWSGVKCRSDLAFITRLQVHHHPVIGHFEGNVPLPVQDLLPKMSQHYALGSEARSVFNYPRIIQMRLKSRLEKGAFTQE